jgi:hypothetical protein
MRNFSTPLTFLLAFTLMLCFGSYQASGQITYTVTFNQNAVIPATFQPTTL